MKFGQLSDSCGRTCAEILVGQPAEDAYEIKYGGMAYDVERMVRAECRSPKNLAADINRSQFQMFFRLNSGIKAQPRKEIWRVVEAGENILFP